MVRNITTQKNKVDKKSEESKMTELKERISEEHETLFFIVHDEAHYSPIRDNMVDKFVNDPTVTDATNVILLQVSATPYCLVTNNSRVPDENRLNWFKKEEKSDYFGIQNFVEKTSQYEETDLEQLIPGTLTEDKTFEKNIHRDSEFVKRLEVEYKRSEVDKRGKNDFLRVSRIYGLIMEYMKGLLEKANIPSTMYEQHFESRSGVSDITKKMLEDIDKSEKGEGKMLFIRVPEVKDGQYFVKILRRMRNLLQMKQRFSIISDIESENERKSGIMANFENEEKHFLPRIQCWNDDGNERYRPSSYKDLANLPVLLIVCEKGKMGITYPKSLSYYDLRLRYLSLNGVTRGAIEQDFGRACRYDSSDSSDDLPTILVSKIANEKLLPRKTVKRQSTASSQTSNGIYKLDPDYKKYMLPNKAKKQVPADHFDLSPYKDWDAGKSHFDCDNPPGKTSKNRYILIGRPQIGKTGAFLRLAFLLWEQVGRPSNIGPRVIKRHPIIESNEESEDANDKEWNVDHFQNYPNFDHIKSMKLLKPSKSPRYGDPNDKDVQSWYLEQGKTYPYPGCLNKNSLLNRTEQAAELENIAQGPEDQPLNSQQDASVREYKIYNKFCAQRISTAQTFQKSPGEIKEETYDEYKISNIGTLLVNKVAKKTK